MDENNQSEVEQENIVSTNENNEEKKDNVLEQGQPDLKSNIAEVAEQNKSEYKPAPNVDMGNAPVVETPKEVEPTTNEENVTFNETAQTIGTLKPDKQKSPLAMLILFSILIAFMLFMPEAIEIFNEKFGTNLSIQDGIYIQEENDNTDTNSNNQNNKTNTTNNTNSDLKISDINDNLKVSIDSLVLSNFKKSINSDKYYIGFSIRNIKNTVYTFNKKLYIDFYDSKDSFIDRVLFDIKSVDASGSVQAFASISKQIYDNGVKLNAVLRSEDDYPNVTLTDNLLTCTKDQRTLKFNFISNKLIRIDDTQNFVKSNDLNAYTIDLLEKKNMVSTMDAIDGVTGVVTENETGYIISMVIDYNKAIYDNLTYNSDYYNKDTSAKTVSFELKSKGYVCK